jgi:DNA-binding helix-hairpin-helix protein with protein kinase domain
MLRQLVTASGATVKLHRELGRGGEGTVYAVDGAPGRVAKIYHRPPGPPKAAKLAFMAATAQPQLLRYAAWPEDTLHARPHGPVVGFLMQDVAARNSIHEVYSPAQRREDRPDAAWDFLLCVARNTAAAFATLHAHGHVLGDVNQGNVVVGRDGRVVLIDCDSFQIDAGATVHRCGVGVSHFTPPELQGIRAFDAVVRTPNHDNFGLALLVFHLLFGGRHPYSGVPLGAGIGEALEADIAAFRYAFGPDAVRRGMASPPRAVPMWVVPPPVQRMFHLAFTEAGAGGARPTAEAWVARLDALRGHLRRCARARAHVYPRPLATCPWCGLEAQGVVHFVDPGAAQAGPPAVDALWARIDAVPAPPSVALPRIDARRCTPRPLPRGADARQRIRTYRAAVVALVLFLCVLAPQGWLFALLAGCCAWGLARSLAEGGRLSERARRRTALAEAQRDWERLVDRVRDEAGPEGFATRKRRLVRVRDAYRRLSVPPHAPPARLPAFARRRAARGGVALRRTLLESALRRGADELQRFRDEARRVATAHRHALDAAARRLAQAESDLSIL